MATRRPPLDAAARRPSVHQQASQPAVGGEARGGQQPVDGAADAARRHVDEADGVVVREQRDAAAVGRGGDGGDGRGEPRHKRPFGRVELPRDEHSLAAAGEQVGAVDREGERPHPLRVPVHLAQREDVERARRSSIAAAALVVGVGGGVGGGPEVPEQDAADVVARRGDRLGRRDGGARHRPAVRRLRRQPGAGVVDEEGGAARREHHRRIPPAVADGEARQLLFLAASAAAAATAAAAREAADLLWPQRPRPRRAAERRVGVVGSARAAAGARDEAAAPRADFSVCRSGAAYTRSAATGSARTAAARAAARRPPPR